MVSIMVSLALFLFAVFPVIAAPIIVVDEDYNNLTLGQPLPNWIAFSALDPTLPIVQNVSVNSAPFGAQVSNDRSVVRPFDTPIEGMITIEIWMDPKLGMDTNNFVGPIFLGDTGQPPYFVGKNETDRWLYLNNTTQHPFALLKAGEIIGIFRL